MWSVDALVEAAAGRTLLQVRTARTEKRVNETGGCVFYRGTTSEMNPGQKMV